jgi:Ni,Fe-hydrogenase I cytochrome b subunit
MPVATSFLVLLKLALRSLLELFSNLSNTRSFARIFLQRIYVKGGTAELLEFFFLSLFWHHQEIKNPVNGVIVDRSFIPAAAAAAAAEVREI